MIMKKIIASLFVLALISCKKDKQNSSNTGNNTPTSDNVKNIESVPTSTTSLKQMDATQISKLLEKKENDTVYVTNFFATWCGPCMHEIPYFKKKMEEMKDKKVKFTFISLDDPSTWDTKVKAFAEESGLGKNIILFNYDTMPEDFFSKNFQIWDGRAIPFTMITKGNKRDEHMGMMSEEDLSSKISSFNQ